MYSIMQEHEGILYDLLLILIFSLKIGTLNLNPIVSDTLHG